MSCWTFSILENYCCYGYSKNKNTEFIDEEGNVTVRKNNNYSPNKKRPVWCKKNNEKLVPSLRCMDDKKGRCDFFGYCEADEKTYKILEKGMKNDWDKELSKSNTSNKPRCS
jgi:hypothetical protein